MTNPNQPPNFDTNQKSLPLPLKIAALIVAATISVQPLTHSSEGTFYKAYLDPVKIPTICDGHTKGVHLGDVATKAQCETYYKQDMSDHMTAVLNITPALVNNKNALAAAGDFAFNAGDKAWGRSPMALAFSQQNWDKGCNAFLGYYVGATYPKDQPKLKCKAKLSAPGKYVCELPGLVKRRINESKLCLTGTF